MAKGCDISLNGYVGWNILKAFENMVFMFCYVMYTCLQILLITHTVAPTYKSITHDIITKNLY